MSGPADWLRQAGAGQPLWLDELRPACAALPGAHRLGWRLRLCDGSERDYSLALPPWEGEAERALAREMLEAALFNCLAALGGRELRLFAPAEDAALAALLAELPESFQLGKARRTGLGKAVSVADRLSRAAGGGPFRLSRGDWAAWSPRLAPPRPAAELGERLDAARARTERGLRCGLDVGGTDVKLVLVRDGRLLDARDFDWDPSRAETAEALLSPLLDMLRAALDDCGAAAFDALGLSFPDVVVGNRVLGGETPKTRGLRDNPALDYEAELARLAALGERLGRFCRPGAPLRLINDGAMAAFTAAMELHCGGQGALLREGVLAHSLGTDLGTGWLLPDGRVPALPLELYDLLLDLGSRPQRRYASEDLRGVRNENSGLPGLRRYLGQAACYRMAWELDSPLLAGFTEEDQGLLRIRSAPEDLRKPCLEHLMARAEAGDAAAEEIFRRVGRHLGHVSRELQWLLAPESPRRFLFGRFVKRPRCFALIREGCAELCPALELLAADESLSRSPLMRQLRDSRGRAAVAAFGQAVGAAYFAEMEA